MGISVHVDAMQQLPDQIQVLKGLSHSFPEKMKEAAGEIFYQDETLYKATANRILEMVNR
jgi:hypothetical protein